MQKNQRCGPCPQEAYSLWGRSVSKYFLVAVLAMEHLPDLGVNNALLNGCLLCNWDMAGMENKDYTNLVPFPPDTAQREL
jgi:hypothetical protein